MQNGFVKVAAAVPEIVVGDVRHNLEEIVKLAGECCKEGAKVVVFPELCVTGDTCGDLFTQDLLLKEAMSGLVSLAERTKGLDALLFVGLPVAHLGNLYNVAAALCHGKILGLVPKTFLPDGGGSCEGRYFAPGMQETMEVTIPEQGRVPMGTKMLFCCTELPALAVAAELCEDLWAPQAPGVAHALAGATVLVNLAADAETTGRDLYRRNMVCDQSARLFAGYIYANAGEGESTSDAVYSGHSLIAENGTLLAESERFYNGRILTEIDVEKLVSERRKSNTFVPARAGYTEVPFTLEVAETALTRVVEASPFVPADPVMREKRCAEIFKIQSQALKKRLKHTGAECAVVGISGGLDSTMALLVTVQAFDLLGIGRDHVIAVTMPGFGTTDRTYDNAVNLIKALGATFMEVDIKDAVRVHFRDIGQEESVHDVTYENSQARERTQILMDIANRKGGLVVGTGDLSELALGWATYNGDHMSMYGVNASVPKTLMRHLVRYVADTCGNDELAKTLLDVLDTPVSPELLPPKEGEISQKTEDIVGPYELHDFYLYQVLRYGFAPAKIYRLACYAFAGIYEKDVILKWEKIFFRRFFTQQYKRSCQPDGPKVGSVSVSPKGDLRMPSDASARMWSEELESLG